MKIKIMLFIGFALLVAAAISSTAVVEVEQVEAVSIRIEEAHQARERLIERGADASRTYERLGIHAGVAPASSAPDEL